MLRKRGRKHKYLRNAMTALMTSFGEYSPGDEFHLRTLEERLKIPWNTARRTVDKLVELGLVLEMTGGKHRLVIEDPIQFRQITSFLLADRRYHGELVATDFPKILPEGNLVDGITRLLVKVLLNPSVFQNLDDERIAELLLKNEDAAPPNALIWEGLEGRFLNVIATSKTVTEAVGRINKLTRENTLATLQIPKTIQDPLFVMYKVSPSLVWLSLQETPFNVAHLPFGGDIRKPDGRIVKTPIPGLLFYICTTVFSADCIFYPQTAKVWKRIDAGARISLTIPGKKPESVPRGNSKINGGINQASKNGM